MSVRVCAACGVKYNKTSIRCACGEVNPTAKRCACGELMTYRSIMCRRCQMALAATCRNAYFAGKRPNTCGCGKVIPARNKQCKTCYELSRSMGAKKRCACGALTTGGKYTCKKCEELRVEIASRRSITHKSTIIKERTRALPVNPRLACPGYDLAGKHHKCAHNAHPLSTLRDGKYHRAQCSLCYNIELGLPPITTTLRWDSFALTSDY